MRHRHSRLRLKQKPHHAKLLTRNLATSVLLYESVRTTKKRAQVVVPVVEKLITIAKTKSPMLAIRQINQVVMHKNASRKAMEVLKQRFANRSSGFTRVVAVGSRKGDGAQLVDLMLLEGEPVENVQRTTDSGQRKSKKRATELPSKRSTKKDTSTKS